MAYKRELDKDEQIVIRKERTINTDNGIRINHPLLGDMVITMLEKSGRRARLSIESTQDFYMEHVGAVKPKSP